MVTAHLNGRIGEQDYTMLVDSGSELNIMTLHQAQELALPIDDSGNSWTLKGISGHTMGLEGICWNVPVRIGGMEFSHNFFVTRSNLGNKDMVAGQPWLFSHSTRIDYIHDMGVTLQIWENGDRKGRSVLINLPMVKAHRNVMPMNFQRDKEMYSMESEFSSRAVEAFRSPRAEFRKPRPIGQDDGRVESVSTGIDLDPVKLGSYFPGSELACSLLQVEELDQLEEMSPALSNESPRLRFLDFGDKFNLGSFQLPGCSDKFDSRDIVGISSSVPEPVMSCVEVLALAPSEPTRVTENESRQPECPIDLELAWIKDYTGNFAMEDSHLLAPTLDMALECNVGHYEANPHQLQSESCYGRYGWNDSST